MYSGPHFTDVIAVPAQPTVEVPDGPLAAFVGARVIVEGVAVFVDGIVCEVHVLLREVVIAGWLVGLGGETDLCVCVCVCVCCLSQCICMHEYVCIKFQIISV